ncbi:hypothetical protein Q5P01_007430 [Channa striata]|uniref:tRNA (34-2'-O)-methyltransferase regulator WDR6 n=1 Tax=Channa striata TaxID=64152 RepID=A0AA88STR5_CHASR|nr:hypothetical protein Q5P01_007430 [Channa striata]
METAALVAPVTALEFLKNTFLLTGEGPVLQAYSLQPQPKACASLSLLQHFRIHGIRPRGYAAVPAQSCDAGAYRTKKHVPELSSSTQSNFFDLAVFGGKGVRLVRLHVDPQDGDHLEILGPLMQLQDWVLDVRWLSGDNSSLLCVALAHNSALLLDVVTGKVLIQRSCLEGCLLYSALLLVHESWADTVFIGGTVFNQLVLWKLEGGIDSENKAPVERRLHGHSGVIFSISYLQEKGWLASASDDRSVRMWSVGLLGGPGGKCGDLNPVCLRVLYGHQARVFSVHLSTEKVFSAGEDGACLVWDWAGVGKVVQTLKGHKAGGVRALAISEVSADEERWVATGGADGGVRLWMVKETEERKKEMEETVTDKLTDLNFLGQGAPKVVCIAGEENANWSQSKFVVCTDQGTVYQYSAQQWKMVWQGSSEFQSYCVMETVSISTKESTDKIHLCAVGNLSGSIHVFPISHPHLGIFLTGGSGKIHSLIWEHKGDSVCLLASGAEGLVYRWCIEVKLKENSFLSLIVSPLSSFLLPPCAKRWLTAAVCIHSKAQEALWVCGDRRGSLLLFQEEKELPRRKKDDAEAGDVFLTATEKAQVEQNESKGNQNNFITEQTETKEVNDLKLQPLSCLFGVHGKQGVTSVYEYQGLFYSTGRDGCVRVFRVQPTSPENLEENKKMNTGKTVEKNRNLQLVILRVQRACKGMEWLERVLILKSEIPEQDEFRYKVNWTEKLGLTDGKGTEERFSREEETTENKGKEARFVIVGFHAVHFVVWDPVRQERLLAVPCGGGHRSWSLWPTHRGVWPGYGALVFIKQGAVLVSHRPGEEPNWAGKAGMTGGWSLREGIHGRGIGCVCRLGKIRAAGNDLQTAGNMTEAKERKEEREEGHWEVVVTGGEDTSLTVLAVHSNSGSIKVLAVITDHISSVRTVTAVTSPMRDTEHHPQSISALLVSAGGRAQMQCYRLLIGWDRQELVPSCQVIQVASHRLDEQWERRRNRHKMVKMDPETRYMSVVVVDETTDSVLMALACSDGAVRLFSVSEIKRQIDLLWESFYHQRCVLTVATCSMEDGEGNRYKLLFSAATDGKIAVWNLTEGSSSANALSDSPPPPIPCLSIPAHQSGVNSLAVWAEKLGQQKGGCLVTVASGGDDGQLTVSRIRVQFPENGNVSEPLLQPSKQLQLHLHAQSHVPLAHAAPLTALKLLSPGHLVSTSSDQRVCLWRVCSTGIIHRGTLCSHVADTAGLAAWEGEISQEDAGAEKCKTTFERLELRQEKGIWREKGNQTELETDGKTGGRFTKDMETADKAKGGEPVEAVGERGDPVFKTCDEKGNEGAEKCRNGRDNESVAGTESEVNTETTLEAGGSRKKETGWLLVCGQGLQLVRVRNTETEAKASMAE